MLPETSRVFGIGRAFFVALCFYTVFFPQSPVSLRSPISPFSPTLVYAQDEGDEEVVDEGEEEAEEEVDVPSFLPDPRFPKQSVPTYKEAAKAISKLGEGADIAALIAEKYGLGGELFGQRTVNEQPAYSEHEWTQASSGFRDEIDSLLEWLDDSLNILGLKEFDLKTFFECFEPRLVSMRCPYCNPILVYPEDDCNPRLNNGWIWEYWWPENEIGLNNFGVSALNPNVTIPFDVAPIPFDRSRLITGIEKVLREGLLSSVASVEAILEKYGSNPDWMPPQVPDEIPEELRGQSQYAGILPGDQTLRLEAHTYRPMVTQLSSKQDDPRCRGCGEYDCWYVETYYFGCVCIPFWYNGYIKGNENCFYDTLDPDRNTLNGWTEQTEETSQLGNFGIEPALFAYFWRFPELGLFLDSTLYLTGTPIAIPGDPSGLIAGGSTFLPFRSCASYRAGKWPETTKPSGYSNEIDGYRDLVTSVGIVPNTSDYLKKICYRGGGQLYPATGDLIGHFSPLPSTAILARRVLEILGRLGNKLRREPDPNRYGVNQFADWTDRSGENSVDKLQRIYPDEKPTKCFKMQDINERNEELFPKDLERDYTEHKGEVRYIHWNKRTACTCQYRGTTSARELDRGSDGWGCQIYPKGQEDKARGNVPESRIQGINPTPLYPQWFPIIPPYTRAACQLWPWLMSANLKELCGAF